MLRHEIPTPALLLNLDAFEANVATMAAFARERRVALRPHAKTHKCPEVARRLVAAGAIGVCAAKLGEAEVFADAGIRGLLITTAVVGRAKIARAIALALRAPDTIFCADHESYVRDLNHAAAVNRVALNVAVDLYFGRTGIAPGEPAAALAAAIAASPNLRFAGLQAYDSSASHVVGFEARRERTMASMRQAVATRRLIEARGIACPRVTGASTGTFSIDAEIDGITEIQPGSFVFMDVDYGRIGGRDGAEYRPFARALSVVTTVISRPEPHVAIVDGGYKAFSTDRPITPEAVGIEGVAYAWAGDEHGRLDLTRASRPVAVGDRIEFVPPHCDPTVNLYDRIYALRGDVVEGVWSIAARGRSD